MLRSTPRLGWTLSLSLSTLLVACERSPTRLTAPLPQASTSAAASVLCPVAGKCDHSRAASDASRTAATNWNVGDVFAGVANGSYQVYDNLGNFKETISDGLGGFTTGCSFNPALDKLYTTNFSSNAVVVYDNNAPHSVVQTIPTGSSAAESIVFDKLGNFYVGHAGGGIEKYDATGSFLAFYGVAGESRGADWVDLAADQTTMHYTSEGPSVLRFDLGANSQLPNFSSAGSIEYALRLPPPFDGTGGLIVANTGEVLRLDGSGNVVQTYDVLGEDGWFAFNLDPNGTSFWSGDYATGNFYRFNIATGAVEVGPISTGGSFTLFGLCVKGETTGAQPQFVIDIQPQDPQNVVHLASDFVRVAVLTNPTLDATTINAKTCRLSGGSRGVPPLNAHTTTADTDGDGDIDLLLTFSTGALKATGNLSLSTTAMRLKCGSLLDNDVVDTQP